MDRRAFTLIEMVITIAIVAIVAVLAVATLEATRRNTSIENTGFDLAAQLQGLRFTALAEQRDHLLVVASPPGNDATQCGLLAAGACVRVFVLRAPQPAWTVAAFDADNPGVNADYVDSLSSTLPPGTLLDLAGVGAPAAIPFGAIRTFAPDVTANCAGGRICLAVRFAASGEVKPEYKPGVVLPSPSAAGVSFGITSDLIGQRAAAQRRAVMVSFPSGIAKTFPY
jgi:prepilin-type N-terminal cleavage/methylation domain-containing protein